MQLLYEVLLFLLQVVDQLLRVLPNLRSFHIFNKFGADCRDTFLNQDHILDVRMLELTSVSIFVGAGRLPENWNKATRYSLTLLRCRCGSFGFRGYSLPDSVPDLHELVIGDKCEQEIVKFVDYRICTMNPADTFDACSPVHPSEKEKCDISSAESAEDYKDLVNKLQRHTKCNRCLRSKSGSDIVECRFGFPKSRTEYSD